MPDSTDSLQRWDPRSQENAYNNSTDRLKVELPTGNQAVSLPSGTFDPVFFYAPVKKFAHLSDTTTGNTIWTPTSGKKFVITDLIFSAVTHGTLKVYDGVDSIATTIVEAVLASGVTLDHTFRSPYPSSAIDTSLVVDCYPGCSGYLSVLGYEI